MNKVFIKALCLFLSAVMLISLCSVIVFAQEAELSQAQTDGVYVSHKNGDDETGNGSEDNPYKTLSKARASLGNLSKIYIVDAEYTVTAGTAPDMLTWDPGSEHSNTITYVGVDPDGKSGISAGGFNFQLKGPSRFENLTVVTGYNTNDSWDFFVGAGNGDSGALRGLIFSLDGVRFIYVRNGKTYTQDSPAAVYDKLVPSPYGWWGSMSFDFANGSYGTLNLSGHDIGGAGGGATGTVNVDNATLGSINIARGTQTSQLTALNIYLDNNSVITDGLTLTSTSETCSIGTLNILATGGSSAPYISDEVKSITTDMWIVKADGSLSATSAPGTYSVPSGSTAYYYKDEKTVKYAQGTLTLATGTYDIKVTDTFSEQLLTTPAAPKGQKFDGWLDDGNGTLSAKFIEDDTAQVAYLSTDGVIDGFDGTVYTTFDTALMQIGTNGGTIYVEGSVVLPTVPVSSGINGTVTVKGFGNIAAGNKVEFKNDIKSFLPKGDFVFDNITVKHQDGSTTEDWIFPNGGSITFGAGCAYEHGYRADRDQDLKMYIGSYYGASGGTVNFNSANVQYERVAALGGYIGGTSSSFTTNGDVIYNLNAGKIDGVYGGMFNSSTGSATLNGDVYFNFNGATVISNYGMSLGSYMSGTVNGNIFFNINGGELNTSIVFGSMYNFNDDITAYGNMVLTVNAEKIAESGDTLALTVANGNLPTRAGDRYVIINHIDKLNSNDKASVSVSVSDLDYYITTRGGSIAPVFAKSVSGNVGTLLGFEATADIDGYVPSVNGLALSKNDTGYYVIESSSVLQTVVFADRSALACSVTLESGLSGQDDVFCECSNGEIYTLPACPFTPMDGYIFAGWQHNGTIYHETDSFTVAGDMIFAATYIPEGSENYFFVSEHGSDDGDGRTLATSFATVKRAVQAVSASNCEIATIHLDGTFGYTDVGSHAKEITYRGGTLSGDIVLSGDSVFDGVTFDANTVITNGNSAVFKANIITGENVCLILGNNSANTEDNKAMLYGGSFAALSLADAYTTDTFIGIYGADIANLTLGSEKTAQNVAIEYFSGTVRTVNTGANPATGKIAVHTLEQSLGLSQSYFPEAQLVCVQNMTSVDVSLTSGGKLTCADNALYAVGEDWYYSVDGVLTPDAGFYKLYSASGEGIEYLPYPVAPDGKYFSSWQEMGNGHLKPIFTDEKTINPYYVSENGSDDNAGTSTLASFKTLTAAVNAIGKKADGKIYIMDTVYWSESASVCNVPTYSGTIIFEGLDPDKVSTQIIDYSRQSVVNGETAGLQLKGNATFKNLSFRAHQWKGFYTFGYNLRFEGKIGYIPGTIGNPIHTITAGGYYAGASSSSIYLGAECSVGTVSLGQNNYVTIGGKTSLTIDGADVGSVIVGGTGADLNDVEIVFVGGSLGSIYSEESNTDTAISGDFRFIKSDGLDVDFDNRANIQIAGETMIYECDKGVVIRPMQQELYDVVSDNTVIARNVYTGEEYFSSKGGSIGIPDGSYIIAKSDVDYYTNDGNTITTLSDVSFDFGKYLYREHKENLVFTGWYFEGTDDAPAVNEIVPAGNTLVARYEQYDASGDEFGIVGVQIRRADSTVSQALRFIMNKNNSFDNKFDITEFGAVVLPRYFLGSQELVVGGTYDYEGYTFESAAVPAEKIYKNTEDGLWYTLCITDIAPKNYGRLYETRAYARCTTANGIEYTLYSDGCSSGLMNVVRNNTPLSEEDKMLFEQIKIAWTDSYFGDGVTEFSSGTYPVAYRVNSSGVGVREITISSNKPENDTVKIAMITDAHVDSNKPDHAASLVHAMECADFADEIILGGDNIEAASSDLDMGQLKRIVWDRYPRTLALLGNHEYFYPGNAGMDAVKQRVDALWPHNPDYYSKVVGDKVLLVLADDARQPEFGVSNYYFTDDKCDKLEADIQYARENGYIILFFHHVILSSLDRDYMANGRMYNLVTSNADVIKACFSGHSHGDSKQTLSASYKDEYGNTVSATIPCYTLQSCSEPDDRGNLLFINVE